MLILNCVFAVTVFPYKQLHEILNNIPDMTWTPAVPQQKWTYEQIRAQLNHGPERDSALKPVHSNGKAPEELNWPDKNAGCVDLVRDQGQCGSCWAFSAVSVFSDRRCIAGLDRQRIQYSEQRVVSCDKGNFGCCGGLLDTVWYYLGSQGTVSDKCYPYTSGTTYKAGTCLSQCSDNSTETAVTSVSFENVCSSVESMKNALIDGPITGSLTIYEDFYLYSSGIYKHEAGKKLGGHAIEIVGYGTENGVPFWNIKNSWGSAWGEKGYFRILRDQNECGIEKECIAARMK